MVKQKKINPKDIKTRDIFMVMIINGMTKSGVQRDQKKHASKMACRGKQTRNYERD